MGRKKLSERDLGKLKLGMLIDYYLGDMKRRGCSEDSIYSNRLALSRFARSLSNGSTDTPLSEATEDAVEDYVSRMQNRRWKFRDHPFRKLERGKLSPFTIRKEIKILKGFGTWVGARSDFEGKVRRNSGRPPRVAVWVWPDEQLTDLCGRPCWFCVRLQYHLGPRPVPGTRYLACHTSTRLPPHWPH